MTADENIINSSRATDFMTPRNQMTRYFRDAVLEFSKHYEFAQPYVNSGRLSKCVDYLSSSLNAVASLQFEAGVLPGAVCIDAPVDSVTGEDWLLSQLGWGFVLLYFGEDDDAALSLQTELGKRINVLQIARGGAAKSSRFIDRNGLAWERYNAQEGTIYLIRPDQHVLGRWRAPDACVIRETLKPCGPF